MSIQLTGPASPCLGDGRVPCWRLLHKDASAMQDASVTWQHYSDSVSSRLAETLLVHALRLRCCIMQKRL